MAESSTASNGFVIPRSSNLYKPKEEEETPDYTSSIQYRENERNPMRTKAYDAVRQAGGNPNAARIAAEAVDFVPGVGEAAGAIDVAQSLKSKEYLGAGLNTAALLLGTVPIIGDVAGKGVRSLAKKLETPKWFKETTQDIDTKVIPKDSQKTQCGTTTGTYKKARALLPEGNTLDYGAGLGLGAKKIKADTFEPYVRAKKEGKDTFVPTYTDASKIPNNSYKNITNLNVLNTVQPEVRDTIVRDIGRILAPNGNAIITTRGIDVFGTSTNPVIGKLGKEPGSVITSRRTYQKGFTNPELLEYVQNTLGKNFTVSRLPTTLGGASVKIVKKSAQTESIEYIPALSAKSRMLNKNESFQYAGPLEVRSLVIPDKSDYIKKFGNPSSALKKNNLPENIIKDSDNNPIVIYRGTISDNDSIKSIGLGKSRKDYASFLSNNPHIAATYAGAEGGVLTPFFIKPKRIIEFPVYKNKEGFSEFDKFEFDIRAKQLKKGEILRAHNVTDTGPRNFPDVDPLEKYSYGSDIYAIKDADTLVNVYSKKFKKGGTMAKDAQAEMITIGLQDEGGMIDEASGNEVPNGALKEEVRDDQPAMLSPGEFVIPAYAVRYVGVERLVSILREAKQGMEQLDDIGLTGEPNSDDAGLETAVLPSEMQNGIPMLAEGGNPGAVTKTALPTQAQQTVFPTPAAAAAPSPVVQAATRTVPIRPTDKNYTYPQLQYNPTDRGAGTGYGVEEYVGPQGQSIFVTTIGGKPLSKVPEGFVTRAQYTKKQTTTPTVPTTELKLKREEPSGFDVGDINEGQEGDGDPFGIQAAANFESLWAWANSEGDKVPLSLSGIVGLIGKGAARAYAINWSDKYLGRTGRPTELNKDKKTMTKDEQNALVARAIKTRKFVGKSVRDGELTGRSNQVSNDAKNAVTIGKAIDAQTSEQGKEDTAREGAQAYNITVGDGTNRGGTSMQPPAATTPATAYSAALGGIGAAAAAATEQFQSRNVQVGAMQYSPFGQTNQGGPVYNVDSEGDPVYNVDAHGDPTGGYNNIGDGINDTVQVSANTDINLDSAGAGGTTGTSTGGNSSVPPDTSLFSSTGTYNPNANSINAAPSVEAPSVEAPSVEAPSYDFGSIPSNSFEAEAAGTAFAEYGGTLAKGGLIKVGDKTYGPEDFGFAKTGAFINKRTRKSAIKKKKKSKGVVTKRKRKAPVKKGKGLASSK